MVNCTGETHVIAIDDRAIDEAAAAGDVELVCVCQRMAVAGKLERRVKDPGLPREAYEISPIPNDGKPIDESHVIAQLDVADTKAALLGIKRSPEGWRCTTCNVPTDEDGRGDHLDGCPKAPVGYLRRDT